MGSGSLLLAMLLHAAIDVQGGLLGWRVLREEESAAADSSTPGARTA